MNDTTKRNDFLITESDIGDLKAQINRGDFMQVVYELCAREPELAFVVSERFSRILTLLEPAMPTDEQQALITKHLSLLVWPPLLLLDRAHRRAWDGFLPLEEMEETENDEGEEPDDDVDVAGDQPGTAEGGAA